MRGSGGSSELLQESFLGHGGDGLMVGTDGSCRSSPTLMASCWMEWNHARLPQVLLPTSGPILLSSPSTHTESSSLGKIHVYAEVPSGADGVNKA